QRALPLSVELKPSVIESPKVTTARVPASPTTSTPLSQYQEVMTCAAGMSVAAAKFPLGETYDRRCASVSCVTPDCGAGMYMLIARRRGGAPVRDAGAERATPRGATEFLVSRAKVKPGRVPGMPEAPVGGARMRAEPMTRGSVPRAFEKRTRTIRPQM